ncbi:hypothetical protein AS189_05720 [Arthrobacter alpinus]|uniref:5-formyltetrahydrofolate cyclo-ligase n=1 Tax=Arthrobacter alpinus TaxID=656366 RepID=A0A0S2LX84_9MICC|nr:5-formyltetrahydrofolate cyclo-ligase [Arthrobacter alpinus]ALO66085.1 hypothetical protein AS189_05720 [Arthrobacter alpinus]
MIMDKAALRAHIRARRRAGASLASTAGTVDLDGAKLSKITLEWLAMLHDGHPGGVVCAYLSTGHEPPTHSLLIACTEAGYTVYVPVCEPNFQLSWVQWHQDAELVRSSLAPVMEPRGPRLPFESLTAATGAASSESGSAASESTGSGSAASAIRAVIVPALAVDTAGVRLGQGGGYYDRFLPRAAKMPLAAVVYDEECVPAGSLPHNTLDMPVGYALTPSAWIRLGAGKEAT